MGYRNEAKKSFSTAEEALGELRKIFPGIAKDELNGQIGKYIFTHEDSIVSVLEDDAFTPMEYSAVMIYLTKLGWICREIYVYPDEVIDPFEEPDFTNSEDGLKANRKAFESHLRRNMWEYGMFPSLRCFYNEGAEFSEEVAKSLLEEIYRRIFSYAGEELKSEMRKKGITNP